MSATRDAALTAARAATGRKEPIKFLDIDAFIIEMSAGERDAFEATQLTENKIGTALLNFRAKLVSKVLVDDQGERLFGDEDIDVLASVPTTKMRKVYALAVKINGFGAEAKELEASKS